MYKADGKWYIILPTWEEEEKGKVKNYLSHFAASPPTHPHLLTYLCSHERQTACVHVRVSLGLALGWALWSVCIYTCTWSTCDISVLGFFRLVHNFTFCFLPSFCERTDVCKKEWTRKKTVIETYGGGGAASYIQIHELRMREWGKHDDAWERNRTVMQKGLSAVL